jgi:hypothetical protein
MAVDKVHQIGSAASRSAISLTNIAANLKCQVVLVGFAVDSVFNRRG